MKVKRDIGKSNNIIDNLGKDDKKVSTAEESPFLNRLKRAEEQTSDEKIKMLAEKIVEQGEKLGNKVDVRELKIYKTLIAEFIDQAGGGSLKFSKESFVDKRGRYRVYASIKKINKELEDLTKHVLSSEQDNIGILKKIEDIRGLILDLIL